MKFTMVNEPRADEEPGLNHGFLRFVAGGVAADAVIRLDTRFGRILASLAAIDLAGSYGRAYRTVADVVAALDANFTHLGTRRGRGCRIVGDLDAYDLSRGIVGRELPEVSVVEGFGHTELRGDELRGDRAASSHRIEEEPLALAGLRDERVERPDIVRTGARRRRRGCNPFKDGFLSDHRELGTLTVAVWIIAALARRGS